MDKIRVGIIGAGLIAQRAHIPSVMKNDGASLVALADSRAGLAASVAKAWHIPEFYGDYRDLICDDSVDAVFVLTNDPSHYEITKFALENGKHVLVEKPLATNSSDAEELVVEAQKHGLVLSVGYMKRYDDGIRLAKQLMDGLGAPVLAESVYLNGNWLGGDPQFPYITSNETVPSTEYRYPKLNFTAEQKALFAWILGLSHQVDTVRFLFGDPKRVVSSALSGNEKKGDLTANSFVSTLDYGSFLLNLELTSAWKGDFTEYYTACFPSGAVLRVDPPILLLRNATARVELRRPDKSEVYDHVGFRWSFEVEVNEFFDAIRQHKDTVSSGREGLLDIQLAEKMVAAIS
ncbi:Gfo/Idh/MocA family oxidoreductase [Tardisphaera miroshnichenkoae]